MSTVETKINTNIATTPKQADLDGGEKAEKTTIQDDKQLDETPKQESNAPPIKVQHRRRHKYQTKDLIREKSPKLDDMLIQPNTDTNIEQQGLKSKIDVGSNSDATLPINKPLNGEVNGKRAVQCNICKRHMTESKLANHIRLLHVEATRKPSANSTNGGKQKEFKCEYCGKSYAIKYTFDQHVKTHIEGRPKCPECGSTFASAFSLFRHRAKTHNLEHNYTTHKCDKCDKTFFSISELTLHQQHRHSSKKDHECPECKKAFSVKGNLRIHMRTHSQEKLYKCDICENSFSHPYSLVSHRRIHTNEFPFQCEKCGKTYRSKHQLTSHSIVHSDERPFKCDSCSKTFRSRTAFKMHQDQHNGIKRFTCKFCDRRFQCHANKLKHERRHIGDKRHKCEFCEKAFIEKQELKNHHKVHEKQILVKEANKNNSTSKESSDSRAAKPEEDSKTAMDEPVSTQD